MKRSMLISMVLCLLMVFCAACALAEEAAPLWQPLLDQWNAQNAEELHANICQYWMDHAAFDPGMYRPKNCPCQIRIGGTTAELLKDKKNWDLAIVSSKDVELNVLIENQLIIAYGYSPHSDGSLLEWLLPEEARALLPYDPNYIYSVYVYDYRKDTDEALLLIVQQDRWRKKAHYVSMAHEFATAMLHSRPAEQTRSLEGINIVYDWTVEELLNRSDEWDVALVENLPKKDITVLDNAWLLKDLSVSPYFATRDSISTNPSCSDRWSNAIRSEDGRILASRYYENGGNTHDLLINAWNCDLSRAMAFAEHLVKSYEWSFHTEEKPIPKNACNPYLKTDKYIPREDMDW